MRSRLDRIVVRSLAVCILVVGVAAIATGCAAHGPRNKARVAALTVGEAALGLDQAERTLYASNVPGYSKADHDRVGKVVLDVLYASRAYERAVAGWLEGQPAPETVDAATQGVLAALTDLEHVLPASPVVRDSLLRAAAAIKAAMASPTALNAAPADLPVQHSEMPVGGVMAILAFAQLAAQLLQDGRTTFTKLLAALKSQGATDEELDGIDGRLSGAIAAREAEGANGGT